MPEFCRGDQRCARSAVLLGTSTAKALAIDVPATLLALADEVIE